MTPAVRPTVEPRPGTAEFLSGLSRGELLLPRCTACGRIGHPGERRCIRCMTASWKWITASGRATIFSYTIFERSFHPSFEPPYTVTIFELEEGPRIIGELAGVALESIEVGLDVVMDHSAPAAGDALLRFHPSK